MILKGLNLYFRLRRLETVLVYLGDNKMLVFSLHVFTLLKIGNEMDQFLECLIFVLFFFGKKQPCLFLY